MKQIAIFIVTLLSLQVVFCEKSYNKQGLENKKDKIVDKKHEHKSLLCINKYFPKSSTSLLGSNVFYTNCPSNIGYSGGWCNGCWPVYFNPYNQSCNHSQCFGCYGNGCWGDCVYFNPWNNHCNYSQHCALSANSSCNHFGWFNPFNSSCNCSHYCVGWTNRFYPGYGYCNPWNQCYFCPINWNSRCNPLSNNFWRSDGYQGQMFYSSGQMNQISNNYERWRNNCWRGFYPLNFYYNCPSHHGIGGNPCSSPWNPNCRFQPIYNGFNQFGQPCGSLNINPGLNFLNGLPDNNSNGLETSQE